MKKFVFGFVSVIIILSLSVCFFSAYASRGIKITYPGQVVDSITYNGVTVDAVYAPYYSIRNYSSNTTYCCAAFVKKFYEQIFGVSVYNLLKNRAPLVAGGNGSFYEVFDPQIGDIVHLQKYNASTNSYGSHWAIVKNVASNGKTITIIEQNGWYDNGRTMARVGKTLDADSSEVKLYRLNGVAASPVTVSTDAATELTDTGAQLNGHFAAPKKVHITEHGVYMGTDPNNMSLVARDTVNYNRSSLTMFYRTSKYYGDLLPGTTYYYKQYVIADDKTYWGEVRSFTTDGKVSCSISGEAYNISDKSASLRITTSLSSPGDIIISALRFGTSPDALHTLEQININQHTDQHVLERDLSEYNLTIEPNKTYYFAASVVVNGRVNVSDIFRFTTLAVIPEDTSEGGPDEEIIPPPEAPIITLSSNTIYVGQTATVQWNSVPNSNHYSLIVSGPVSVISEMNGNETWSELSDLTEGTYSINVWASGEGGSSPKSNTLTLTVLPVVITHHVFTKPATNITATSAQFNGSFSSDAKPHMTEHGVYMGTDPVTMEKVAVDKVDYYKSSLTMFYSTSKYYGTLMPDTTYYYCEYVVVDGVELRGETLSFKTSPSSGNMRYGVVHVNSGALAINDAPRASNKGSNPSKQIGRIPNGQTCIVDLSRTSGNWYWVTYNGVSGYAYKSYISLQ